MMTPVERFAKLFAGFDKAYGTYARLDERAGQLKKEIKTTATTRRLDLTPAHWQKHIDGVEPLGVIPINADNACTWGCVDIDVYSDISHAYLAELCEKHQFPAVVCRSKSGGAHVFLFVDTPIPCVDMREKLAQLAVVLGAGQSEIFPKQNEVLYDRGDLGHWLNMPYFDADKTTRFCVTADSKQLSLVRFLDYAEKRIIPVEDFIDIGVATHTDPIEDLEEGPPCLKILATRGFPAGTRNNGMFALGVLAKKKFQDAWETKLEDWNRRFMDPPLDMSELLMIVRSLGKKTYEYRCKDVPIVNFCDSKLCRKQKFGVGGGGNHPVITGIKVLTSDPKLFFVALSDGGAVECNTAQLLNPRLFQQCALDQCMKVLPIMKMDEWTNQINKCMENKVEIEAAVDIGARGVFYELLERFCTDKHRAQTREEMLLGKPWFDEATGRYYFRLRDLMEFLDRMKFKELSRTQVSTRIREWKGDSDFMVLHGKGTNVWYIPDTNMTIQAEPHDVGMISEVPI